MLNFAAQLRQLAQGMKSEEPDYHAIHTFLGPSLEPRSGGFPAPVWNGPDQAGGGGQVFDIANGAAGTNQIPDAAVTGPKVAPGAIDMAAFAVGIVPTRKGAALPTLPDSAYPEGSTFTLTATWGVYHEGLYRQHGGAWSITAYGQDLAAHTVEVDKLLLLDDFGETILDASGFGETWDDFIASGIRNNMFAKAIPGTLAVGTSRDDPAGRYSHLPNWTVWRTTGSGTASVVADPAWPGGHYVACQFSNTGSLTTNNACLTTDPFPVQPGDNYVLRVVAEFVVGAGGVDLEVRVLWYDSAGTYLSEDALAEWGMTASAEPAILKGDFLAAAPLDTRFARLEITAYEYTTHSVTNTVRLGQVQFRRTTSSKDIEQVRGVPIGDGGITYEFDSVRLSVVSRITTGNAFPTAGLTAGDLHFRTDAAPSEWYKYDGATWLSVGLHYVSLGGSHIQVVPDASTTTAPIAATTCAEMTALPAKGVVAIQVIAQMLSTVVNAGNAVWAGDYNLNPATGGIWAVQAFSDSTTMTFPNTGTITTGGTNNRRVVYQVPRAAGTITYWIQCVGYWAHVIAT